MVANPKEIYRPVRKDFSNKTVIVVLVLFILVSVVALMYYIKAVNTAVPEVKYQSSAQGVALLTIEPTPGPVKTTDQATGQATLTIVE